MKTSIFNIVIPLLLSVTILLFIFPAVRCLADIRQLEKQILDNLTSNSRYDARIRPNGIQNSDGPVEVRVNMFLRSLSKISETNMDYSLQVTFRQQWSDSRLQFDDFNGRLRYLNLRDHNLIWKPDLFFSNEKEGHMHELIQPNYLIRITPDGKVLYSVRLSLVLSCPMDLKNFPFDTQMCSVIVASYGYTTEDIVFLWKEGDPVQVTKNLHLPIFSLSKFMTDYCTSKTNTGEYSCLKVSLSFKRAFSYYFYHTYIPFANLVILSWISFWINVKRVVTRLSLTVAVLLTMSILTRGINLPIPKTSYVKAIDVWTGVCHLFAFLVLFEFALVSFIHRKSSHQNTDKENAVMNSVNIVEIDVANKVDKKVESPQKGKFNWRVWMSKLPTGPKKIDVLSAILFPVAFIIFNLIYWTTYCSKDPDEW